MTVETKKTKKKFYSKTKSNTQKNKNIDKVKKDVQKSVAPPTIVNRQIPMYDPFTGDVNMDYEKITGKKNPLLEGRNNTLNLKLQGNAVIEFKRENRFLIKFPEEFGVKENLIVKTSRPSMYIREKKIFGIKYSSEIVWNDIKIEIMDPIGNLSTTKRIFTLFKEDITKEFNYTIEMLDPTGVVIEKWLVNNCLVKTIDFGDLSYISNDLSKITLVITPKDIFVSE